jgi:hypothetical protein
MMMQRRLLVPLLLCSVVLLTSCDPSTALNKAFAKLGLTRLALIRDDIQPGAVMVRSKSAAVFADNITDYVPSSSLKIQFEDKSKDVSAYIPTIEGSSNIKPKLALDLLASLVPLNSSADFEFASSVSIKQMDCKVKRVPVTQITEFLIDPDNSGLTLGLKPYFDAKNDVFIAYEVWRSSSINFDSETKTDVTTSLKVGDVKPISKAEVALTVDRTAKEKLTVSGDQPYAFAVKLLKLERDPESGNLSVKLTDFKPPDVLKGPDDQNVFVDEGMEGITVKRVPKIQRLAVLESQ